MTLLVQPRAASAQASALHVVLRYEVQGTTQGCPTAAELQSSVVQQLGYDPFEGASGPASHEVRVKIARQGGGAEAHIEWLDEGGAVQGERRLSSPDDDCAELAAGVVFATAVQLQLRAASTTAPPAPPPSPPSPPAPPKAHTQPPASRSVLIGGGALGRFGRQPGVAAGLRAFASIGGQAWAFQLDAHATLPTRADAGGGAGFSAREMGVGAAPCFRHRAVDACALGSFTLLSVRGEGVDRPQNPSAVGVGVGVRLQLTLPWHERVAAVVHADVLAQLTPREVLLNRESAWSTAPVAVALGLDVAAIFR